MGPFPIEKMVPDQQLDRIGLIKLEWVDQSRDKEIFHLHADPLRPDCKEGRIFLTNAFLGNEDLNPRLQFKRPYEEFWQPLEADERGYSTESFHSNELLQVRATPPLRLDSSDMAAFMKLEEIVLMMANKVDLLGRLVDAQMALKEDTKPAGVVHCIYAADQATTQEDETFRQAVLKAYGYSKREIRGKAGRLNCVMLNYPVQSDSLIATHLFKKRWDSQVENILGFSDIDDPRNGLPLFAPIKYGFDTLKLTFLLDENDDIICHVLDPELLDLTLLSIAEDYCNANQWKEAHDPILARLTFRDIDRRALTFATHHRPYRRVLNFQARQARFHAIRRNWKTSDWDFEDFYEEGMASEEKVKFWFEHNTKDGKEHIMELKAADLESPVLPEQHQV